MDHPIPNRLAALRQLMARQGIAACLVPSADPHQSEYLPAHWATRAWLSGFTGSAGTLVVTPTAAGLWTDARYFLQAETQLQHSGIELQRLRVAHTAEYIDWLAEHLPPGSVVAADGAVLALSTGRLLRRRLAARDIELDTRHDLPGQVWTNRPPLPDAAVEEFPDHLAGQTRAGKLADLRTQLSQWGLGYYLLTALDDVAWTLNIRATDVTCNPLCISFLLIGQHEAWWFVGEERLSDALRHRLESDGVYALPYSALESFLDDLPADVTVGIDPTTTSMRIYEALGHDRAAEHLSPAAVLKCRKNPTEVALLREAMRKDGVALLRLLHWLDGQLAAGATVTEVDVAHRLDDLRRQQGDYRGESFGAIVGYQANGAIIHYQAQPAECATLRPEGLLLIDSGGQYLQGTTDITRTIALGPPTAEQKRHFTLVLKGHIALARARFPEGTTGVQLDTLARLPLWEAGLNYGHGTGHGVGFFLSVHEGPQRIAANPAAASSQVAIQPGMLTSNEPGLYLEGQYGIRIENLILCVPDQTTPSGPFLRFDTLSLFPISPNLIDATLLLPAERDWLNAYHQQVYAELSPRLTPAEQSWLQAQCAPLTEP